MKRFLKILSISLSAAALLAGCGNEKIAQESINNIEKGTEKSTDDSSQGETEGKKFSMPTIGDKAPEASIYSVETGEKMDWNKLLEKPVLLNFFSTNCGPCRAEMPDLDKLYRNHKDQINIVAVAMGEDDEVLKAFKSELNLELPLYSDDEDMTTGISYFVRFVPTTYMINTDEVITRMVPGMMDYEQMEKLIDGGN